ncbi:MAG: exodeoxyribonuclease III [Deltaproteobacteria bacterium]|nr:exodeoxyribonuclease III [Deltaproteobacteria bacterium]
MKIATFNANSIRTRISIIMEWLEKEWPDILCLQETKAQDKDFPLSDFKDIGYNAFFRGQKSYNGVAFISRQPISDIRKDLYDSGDEQARFISGRLLDTQIINVYVPQGVAPGTDKFEYKIKWLRDLLSHVKATYNPGEPLLMVGDFNVALQPLDVYDPEGLRGKAGFHEEEQKAIRDILQWGFTDLFRQHEPAKNGYTFWDYRIPNGFKRNMGWRIDYMLATDPLAKRCENVWVDMEPRKKEKPSDHTFLVAEFKRLT